MNLWEVRCNEKHTPGTVDVSRREDIDNAIWTDPEFEVLSLEASILYLWSWTNQRCGMAGIYKASRRSFSESKVPDDRLDSALAELAAARFMFYEDQVVFVRARVKRLRQKTSQIAVSIANDVAKIPDTHPLKAKFLGEYSAAAWLAPYLSPEALSLVSRGSGESQNPSAQSQILTLPRGSVDPQGQRQRQGTGSGKGKGNGKKEDAHARVDWWKWAEQHVPDLPADFVGSACIALHGAGRDVTADEVRARVLAQRPWLVEGDAA